MITFDDCTVPNSENAVVNDSSVAEYGKLPTYNFVLIKTSYRLERYFGGYEQNEQKL